MRPELFSIGSVTLNSFGAMMAIALIAAWWFVRRDLEERGFDPEAAFWLLAGAGVGGVAGARLWYVATEPGAPLFSGSGLTWYGGLIGGAIGVTVAALWWKLPIPTIADVSGPAIALGYAIGRIGCQLAGDGDYGTPSDLPWAMSYPDGTVPTDVTVHPTPLYETFAMLVVFWVLWRLRFRIGRPGALFGLWAVLSGVERLLIEFLRRNDEVLGPFTVAQLVSIGLIVAGAVLLVTRRGDPADAGRGGRVGAPQASG